MFFSPRLPNYLRPFIGNFLSPQKGFPGSGLPPKRRWSWRPIVMTGREPLGLGMMDGWDPEKSQVNISQFPRWWFRFFLLSPLPGEDSHFDQYFSNGLKPPTRIPFCKGLDLHLERQWTDFTEVLYFFHILHCPECSLACFSFAVWQGLTRNTKCQHRMGGQPL